MSCCLLLWMKGKTQLHAAGDVVVVGPAVVGTPVVGPAVVESANLVSIKIWKKDLNYMVKFKIV